MSIQYSQQPKQTSQIEFQEVDYLVMQQAFSLQNEIGNLWDEHDYQTQLAMMCKSIGLDVHKEVCISVSHEDFSKSYFIDLLINGKIYELKAVSSLIAYHHAQTLNYIFLSDTRHGKIINFRPDSVEWQHVSTSLSDHDRHNFTLDTTSWHPTSPSAQEIPDILNSLLCDWGAYLSIDLYKEALCHFLKIPIIDERHRFTPLSSQATLYISGLSERKNNLESNLRKYLQHADIKELLWLNFHKNTVHLCSLNHSA